MCECGAKVERGKVVRIEDGGYIIASYDRSGIETPPLTAVFGEYSLNDDVYFFLFNDGTGRVLCSM